MNERARAVQSLTRLGAGRRKLYVVPFVSLAYGLASLVVIMSLLFAVDRILGSLEKAGWTTGEQWGRDNKVVEENRRKLTTTNECELRHWIGQPLPKEAANRKKILVIGDSFVWGPPYSTLNHLWWRKLANELERRGYRQVDVVAAGHPGWSTHRELDCLRQLLPLVKPDLVIWGYVTNDPDEKVVRQIFDSQDRPFYGQRIRQKLKWLWPNLSFKFESLRNDKLAVQYAGPQYGYAYPDWELELLKGENFERYRQTVQLAGDLLRESQVPAFLMPLPHFPGREYFKPRYGPVLEQWSGAGVTVNNDLDEFIRRFGDVVATGPAALEWGINPADSHPGPQATQFHAEMAADFVEQMWPEVLGPKELSQAHELVINDWLPFDLDVKRVSENKFEATYPESTGLMPRLPLDEPTAMVSLRFPLPLREIRIDGADLGSCRMWVAARDEHGTGRWHDLGRAANDNAKFKLPAELALRDISEIRFTAAFDGSSRQLRITFERADNSPSR